MAIKQTTKQRLARQFAAAGLIKFGQFTLKSGVVSPFYIDLRRSQSHPETFHTVVEAYSQLLTGEPKDTLLAGVPEAATPLAAAVGYRLKRRLVQPRKVVKSHGTKQAIEGDFQPGEQIILLDDLITKGDSKLEAIKQVEAAGLRVAKLLVLVDREQGGVATIANAGYRIEAAITISELLNELYKLGAISHKQYRAVQKFINQ